MEDGLVLARGISEVAEDKRLNPCCNGRWSRTRIMNEIIPGAQSLNPCCNGRWSRTGTSPSINGSGSRVLILVVMEDGLVHY